MSFDELQFDVKSTNFKVLKNTSNTIRSNVFSVIDVFYDFDNKATSSPNGRCTAPISEMKTLEVI